MNDISARTEVPEFTWLSRRSLLFLYLYYFTILPCGIGTLMYILMSSPGSTMSRALGGGTASGVTGAAAHYLRKLYKLSLRGRVKVRADLAEADLAERWGLIAYFLARPILAAGFSLIVVVGLLSGLLSIAAAPAKPDSGFVLVTVVLCFFTGSATGAIIDVLDERSQAHAQRIFGGSQ